ncbi:hypothetical protein U9M48_036735 [Paspalum notatum var. saurae]|uniref:Uncharacterized protein n=1 Tax=Paspalum notatum var. saurae TaxID=547442 RepID=A0AAQ3X998_PASNO
MAMHVRRAAGDDLATAIDSAWLPESHRRLPCGRRRASTFAVLDALPEKPTSAVPSNLAELCDFVINLDTFPGEIISN